jgi:predicted RNase H-like HicB family nuclease
MVLIGRIAKQEDPFWSADVDAIGAHTQGTSREDAFDMLQSLIKLLVDRKGFVPTLSEIGQDDDGATIVYVTANEPALLAALVLKYQRQRHHLSLSDVEKKLGRDAYARYEEGTAEPSIGEFTELLAAVAPELVMTVEPRGSKGSKAAG